MSPFETPNLQPFVDRLTSRSVLTEQEKQAILDLPCRAEQVQANRDFVRLGERHDSSCVIVAGLVGRFDQTADGARQITAIHIPGDMPDLASVVQPQATSALQALSVATILRIPHSSIRQAAARHHALAEALWRDCMVDSAILSQWVVNVGRRDARARIGHLLCEMATRLAAPTEAGTFSFPFPVSQTQLADATGLTVVHVNRVLRALRESGLVHVRAGEAKVLDWDALVAVGDFDPAYLQTDIPPHDRLRIVPPS
jgi:CRP-like cAMP-binding protein